MSLDLIDYKPTLVQIMAWCCQPERQCLNQYWPRPQRVVSFGTLQWRHMSAIALSSQITTNSAVWAPANSVWHQRNYQSPRCTGAFCDLNPPVVGAFPTQSDNNTQSIFVLWRHPEKKWPLDIMGPLLSNLPKPFRDHSRYGLSE